MLAFLFKLNRQVWSSMLTPCSVFSTLCHTKLRLINHYTDNYRCAEGVNCEHYKQENSELRILVQFVTFIFFFQECLNTLYFPQVMVYIVRQKLGCSLSVKFNLGKEKNLNSRAIVHRLANLFQECYLIRKVKMQ